MDKSQVVIRFWKDVAAQDAVKLTEYFSPDAIINWHNTNEQFSVEEYMIANCDYPGDWHGNLERIELVTENLVISVARVWLADRSFSCHAVSFFQFREDRIIRLDEYWGEDGEAPQWRLDKKIGNPVM